MGRDTLVSWCHHTFNPWIGCEKVSDECRGCYAEVETYPRVQRARGRELWGRHADRHVTSAATWRQPELWNRAAEIAGERRRVFCASLADVFEDRRDLDAPRVLLWRLIERTPWLDWLLLTKRPENHYMVPDAWQFGGPSNVWFGATIGSPKRKSMARLDQLLVPRWPAVRFLSCEPLLGRVVLPPWAFDMSRGRRVDWIITGAESGRRRRELVEDDVRALRDQAVPAGAAFYYKQKMVGALKVETPLLDGRRWTQIPRGLGRVAF